MSIALERGGGQVEAAGFVRRVSCIAVFDPKDAGGDRSAAAGAGALQKVEGAAGAATAAVGRAEAEEGEGEEEATSCSSSIGRNSDSSRRSLGSDGEEAAGEAEVQSALKGPLDSTAALEEALPIRRGISKFYCGKSKSFASLADISSSSADDLGKPENAYSRKRKNRLAMDINFDLHRCSPLGGAGGGIVPKRPANSTSSAAAADGSRAERDRVPPLLRPPLPPINGRISPPQRCHFTGRSFSLMDLQVATAAPPSFITPSDKLHQGLQ